MLNKNVKTQVEMTHRDDGDVAVVRMLEGGQVEVERNGSNTLFRPHHTFRGVLDNFSKNGWVTNTDSIQTDYRTEEEIINEQEEKERIAKEALVASVAENQGIPTDVQNQLDEYLKLHEQKSELEKQLKELKEDVRDYMESNKRTTLSGTHGRKVEIQGATASNSTSKYTDYDLKDVAPLLEGNLLRKTTEIRVNTEKLEGLLKVEKLPKETVDKIKKQKIRKKGTPKFVVKKN